MKKSLLVLSLLSFAVCAEQPKSLKVLMIGNSFSICATRYMPQVAKSMGLELDLGSLYIGGCSLARHWTNCVEAAAKPDFKPYGYQRFTDGKKVLDVKANIPEILASEKWDIVTLQQASHFSWKPETYRPFADDIIDRFIKPLAPQAEIVIQETWSYTPWDRRLARWGMTPAEMYAKLHAAYAGYAAGRKLRTIPMGAAVQEWRARLPVAYTADSFGGDVCGSAKFVPDAAGKPQPKGDVFHLNDDGCYLQALVWTAKLYGADVTTCAFAPKKLAPARAELMKKIAVEVARR